MKSCCSGSGYRTSSLVPKCIIALLFFAGLLPAFVEAQTRTVRVAAAADLQPVMPSLATAFEKKSGIRVVASFGSSSSLAEQILNGAPFDVFLGADFVFPEKIVAANRAATAPKAYAKGSLVLLARKDGPFNPLHLEALSDPSVRKVAIADQFHAPFGLAAYAALDKLKLLQGLSTKLVVAENVAQTAQFVISGNAQLGLVSLSMARSLQHIANSVPVPASAYPAIVQYGVVIKNAGHRTEGEAFLDFIRSNEVQANLGAFGLDPYR